MTLSVTTMVLSVSSSFSFMSKQRLMSWADIQWTGNPTGLDKRIRTDGVYVKDLDVQDSGRWKNEKCYLLFYPDGTFIPVEYLSNLSDLKNNIHHKRGHRFKSKKERWCLDAGVYKVYGDTIEVNRYYDEIDIFCQEWGEMEKLKFKIIDSTTICRIEAFYYDAIHPSFSKTNRMPYLYHFVEVKNIPSPKTKLKREKWLWNLSEGVSKKVRKQ